MSNNTQNLTEENNQKNMTYPSNAEKDMNDQINPFQSNRNNIRDSKNIVTINNISVCQSCLENFNNKNNIPFLFKCGHFFCKNCILNKFKDNQNNIKCPEDDTTVNSLDELKLLNKLLVNDVEEMNEKYCISHPNQTLTHLIENTKEIVCVYCAFSKYKKYPNLEIKELKEKSTELVSEISKIIEENQSCIRYLENYILSFEKIKSEEIEKINVLFDEISKHIEEKKAEMVTNIQSFYENNNQKTKEALDIFNVKMREVQSLKESIENYQKVDFIEVLNNFNNFSKEYLLQTQRLNYDFVEYKFIHDDINKLPKFLNSICDIKAKQHQVNFIKLVLSNGKIVESIEVNQEQEEKKHKQKDKKEYIIDNLSTSDIMKKNDNKLRGSENDDCVFSKLKKELLFNNASNNNRIVNPTINTFTFESKNNKLLKSSNLKDRNMIDYDNFSTELEVLKNKKKNKNDFDTKIQQNLFSSKSHFGDA